MKIIYVMAENDYDALDFEEAYGDHPTLELWEKAKSGEIAGKEYSLMVKALEFKEVDPKFLQFIQNELMDYDDGKHQNFYVVEE